MKLFRHPRASRAGDDGFSLAETLVALGIAAVALFSLLGTSIFALRSSVEGRQNQLAGDLLNAAVEEVRSLGYAAVSMTSANVTATTDASINKSVTPYTYDPGEGPAEPLDMQATGGSTLLTPYVQQKVTASGPYTVRRYITVPAGTPTVRGLPAVRRLTVVVTWQHYGKTHERRTGTLITNTRRGLPLPSFNWTYNGPATIAAGVPTWAKNPNNPVDYGFVLLNKGARDSWALTTNPANPAWTWYEDLNANGLYESGEPALGSTSFATGEIEAGAAPFYVVAHRNIGSVENGTTTTVFTAASISQPTYPAKSVTTSLTVGVGAVVPSPTATASPTASPSPTVATVCSPGASTSLATPGTALSPSTQNQYTITNLSFYNGPPDGDTTTIVANPMGTLTSLLQPSPCNYSTESQTNEAGRLLTTGSTAEWRFQPTSAVQDEFRGTAVVRLWVQCPGSGGSPSVTADIGTYSTQTFAFVSQGSASATASGCPSAATQFHRVEIAVPLSTFTVANGTTQRLSVRVTVNRQVRLLYGNSSTPAVINIGMK